MHINTTLYSNENFCENLNNLKLPHAKKTENISASKNVKLDSKGLPINKEQIYRDEATKLVLKYFLSNGSYTDTKYINAFLPLVFDTFNKHIDCYWNNFSNDKAEYHGIKSTSVIYFFLKGGNLNKIMLNKLSNSLKVSKAYYNITSDDVGIINNFLSFIESKKINERSDFDFGIVINMDFFRKNNKISDYEKIYADMKILSFYCLDIIRNQILNNTHLYFNFHSLDNTFKNKILAEFAKQINASKNSSVYNDVKNKYCVGIKFNNFIFGKQDSDTKGAIRDTNNVITWEKTANNDADPKKEKYYNSEYTSKQDLRYYKTSTYFSSKSNIDYYNTSNSPLYISIIENITMQLSETHFNILEKFFDNPRYAYDAKFDLVRLKLNFMGCFYDESTHQFSYNDIPGELIDVAINYIDPVSSTGKESKIIYNDPQSIVDYSISTKYGSYTFKGISHTYILHDLENILFEQPPFPWADKKFEKRITRYFIMFIINNSIIAIDSAQKKELLLTLDNLSNNVSHLKNIFNHFINDNFDEGNRKLKLFFPTFVEFMRYNEQNNILFKFSTILYFAITQSDKITPIVFKKGNPLITNLSTYLNKVHDIIIQVNLIMHIIFKYNINVFASISDKNVVFGGGNKNNFFKKYKKYKLKYLQLK